MKPLDELLSEREFYVYQERKKGRTYKSIGEEMGINANRASALLNNARRKVREAKRRDINASWNDGEETFTLQRREIFLIERALRYYSCEIEPTVNELRNGACDPEYELLEKLQDKLRGVVEYDTHPSRVDFEEYWNQDAGF